MPIMPSFFSLFLSRLSEADATKLHDYLDGAGTDATYEIVGALPASYRRKLVREAMTARRRNAMTAVPVSYASTSKASMGSKPNKTAQRKLDRAIAEQDTVKAYPGPSKATLGRVATPAQIARQEATAAKRKAAKLAKADKPGKAITLPEPPIPVWAGSMVSNYRTACLVPSGISDRRLFDFIRNMDGFEQADIMRAVKTEVRMNGDFTPQ